MNSKKLTISTIK